MNESHWHDRYALFFSGINITWIVFLVFALALCAFLISDLPRNSPERIIGYEIDEMRTPDNRPYFDTLKVIIRKGEMIFVKDFGAYTHLTRTSPQGEKESTLVRELEAPIVKSAVNSGPANGIKKIFNPSTKESKNSR